MTRKSVVVVTGGSVGIGATLCRRFAADDYEVVSLSRRPGDVVRGVTHIGVDLLDADATAEVARNIAGRYEVSHIVHNAGVIRANLLDKTSTEDLAALTQLHLAVPLTLAQALTPGMQARQFGRIILMSSRAALGLATRTVYATTKAGMLGMARTWALELGPHGITVNVVSPGPIGGTEMFHDVMPVGDPRIAALAASIPVKRLGTADDVARAVMFFAAAEADFVTGQVLYVCGGASIGSVPI
jgi:3-oxoacyl-[acyl-carrier protein] reductase